MSIRVNGTTGGGTTTSSDATLSALALADASNDSAIIISPVFASGTTSYTASVVNGVDEITVAPTVNESNATVEYLDSSDTAITDADSVKAGRQVSLSEGANTIKVKVTAQDATTTETYTVVVTRNTAPTAAVNTVTTAEDTAYTFAATDFGFADADGDTLASVKIVTLPTPGELALDGTAVLADAVVAKADIDDNKLIFTPVAGATGDPYTTFTFKVNDGTDDSASAYTMTIDVTSSPAITIAADRPTATGKIDWIHYTLSRGGDPAAELTVTVTFEGPAGNDWSLDPTGSARREVTFTADSATAEQSIQLGTGVSNIGFSESATTSGTLTARLGAKTGYDTSNTDEVQVVVTSGPAWVIKLADDAYRFTEDGGDQNIELVATAASADMPAPSLDSLDRSILKLALVSQPGTATSSAGSADYAVLASARYFPSSTCSADAGNVLVCRLDVPFTPVNDAEAEPDETLTLDLQSAPVNNPAIHFQGPGPDRTVSSSAKTYTVTIVDDDFGVTGVDVTSTPQQAVDTYGAWEHIELSVSFNKSVTVTGAPTFTFDLGGTPTTAAYQGGSGTGTLVFSYQVMPGDSDSDGIAWAADALAGGAIVEMGGTATPTLTVAVQAALSGHEVDGTQTVSGTATVSTVAVTSTPLLMASGSTSADTYGVGETIEFTVTFSAAVTVTGDPRFAFSLSNPPDRLADYNPAASTATALVFRYTVLSTDEDTDGIWVGDQSRTLKLDSDDRILTESNSSLPASLTHDEQGTLENHKVDGSRGTPVTNTAPTASDNTVTTAEDTFYTFTATDFGYEDADSDPLASVKIVTLPASGKGTLELSGTAVAADEVVPAASIGNLAYIPPADANGTGYASFTFKVNDGTVDSDDANTMTIDVTPGNDPATGAPTITGTARVGQTLTAVTTGILDADGLTSSTYIYQWIRVNGTDADIAGANSSTYTLGSADLGKTIKVEVSFTDDGGNAETLTSAETATVAAATTTATCTGMCLVSNLNQVATTTALSFGYSATQYSVAQGFMTGASTGGYTLTSIEVAFDGAQTPTQLGNLTVSVRADDGSGNPATANPIMLIKPSSIVAATDSGGPITHSVTGNYTVFTAPPNTTLDPSTTYHMVLEGGYGDLWSTAIGGETGATGWSIADAGHRKQTAPTPGNWTAASDDNAASNAMLIRVNGTTGGGTTSSDATLSALALEDASDDTAITISPAFVSGTTSYTASVDNGVDVITIDPTVNESNATVEYLDSSDTEIADADSGKAGRQVSLAEGANTIKVKVTAQDTTTTNTYTVVVTRAASTNNAPVFGSSTVALDLEENTVADQDVGAAVAATDADNDTLAYTLGGAGMASFGIDGTTGQIRTISGVSYDHEARPSYTVTVTASDGTDSAVADVTISITDVDEPPVAPATPTVLAAAGSNTSLTVSWTAPANAGKPDIDSYDVQYRASGAAAWIDGPQNVTTTTTTIASLTAATEYEAQVRATNDEGVSGWSDPPGSGRTNSPANTAAEGAPTITGTAQVGETLTAATTGITDADGLANATYTYQWIRVDGSEADIAGANSSTYILDAADLGKTIKVRVTFTDDAGNSETLTSEETATVDAVPNTAPTAADNTVTTTEDTAYTFTAGDFGFVDTDGDTLASVRIVALPAEGRLRLSGAAVTAPRVVTRTLIDGNNFTFTPEAGESGTGYATFTFKVNDGTDDSAGTYTMTIDVKSAPGAPTGLTATADGPSRIDLAWTAPVYTGGSAITGYRIEVYKIEVSENDEGNSISRISWSDLVADTASTATTYSHTGLDAATTRHYRVSAINAVGTSDSSVSADATTTEAAARTDVLVGNFNFSGDSSSVHLVGQDVVGIFTTGGSDATLDSIELKLGKLVNRTVAPTVKLYAVTVAGSRATLGTEVATLITPSTSLSKNSFRTFTYDAPIGTSLTASTKYIFVLEEPSAGIILVETTTDPSEDAGTANGWTIDGSGRGAGPRYYVGGVSRLVLRVNGTLTDNTAPTAADNTVTIAEDGRYEFSATDFRFADTDTGDRLASVKIVTLPAAGTLALGGTDVTLNKVVTKTRIDDGDLTFTPATGASGDDYASFMFKVNDGTDDSAGAYTMTIDVDDAPDAPATPAVSAVSGSTTSLTVSWAAPANAGGPAITSYDVQYRVSGSGPWIDGPQDVTGTSATVTATVIGLVADTLYEARVRATSADVDSGWSDPPGSGRTNSTTNNAPVFSPAIVDRSVAENTAAGEDIGAPVTATDADAGDTLTYTLGGTDAASFDIVETTGQIRTKANVSYDFEARSSYTVTVTATDTSSATAVATVTISVTNVDEGGPPDAPATPAVSAVPGSTTSLAVSWAAPANVGRPAIDGYDVQYRVGSSGTWTDVAQDVTGTTTSITITGLVADTSYEVQVRATNAEGESGWSDPPGAGRTNALTNIDPVFDPSSVSRSVAENTAAGEDIGAAVTATDADNDTLTYTLGGADAGSFGIVETTGQIRTISGVSYNYEAKASYTVTVTVSDGIATAVATVTISITDVDELPDAPATPTVSAVSGSTISLSVSWTAPANTGPPIKHYSVHWRISGAVVWGAKDVDAPTTTTIISDLLADTEYEVQVRASNAERDSEFSEPWVGRTNTTTTNNAPVFSSPNVALGIAENTAAGEDVGAAVEATDADAGDTLSYTLRGTDAEFFDIVDTTGQIRTKDNVSYDFEARPSYTVTVRVSDSDATAEASVIISITDVDEPPVAPATPTVSAVADSNTRLSVSWDAPANAGKPAIASYDVQYRASGSGTWIDGPQDVTDTTTPVSGLTANTLYEVQVRATTS